MPIDVPGRQMFEDAFGKRLGPPLFTISFTVALMVLLGGATLGIIHGFKDDLRSLLPPTTEEIAAAVVKALPKGAAPSTEPTIAAGLATTIGNLTIPYGDRMIEQPTIEWDGKGPVIFHARVDRAIEKQPIYLDWGQVGSGANLVLNNGMMSSPRVEIGFIDRLAAGQIFSVTIGDVSNNENGQQYLQWGEAHYNNPKVPIFASPFMARVVIIRKDQKEEQYPFLIVPRDSHA